MEFSQLCSNITWFLGFICGILLCWVLFAATRPKWSRLYKNSYDKAAFDFSNHVVLITGAGAGIGQLIAVKLLGGIGIRSQPHMLVLLDCSEEGLRSTKSMLDKVSQSSSKAPPVECHVCDVSDPKQVKEVLQRIKSRIAPRQISVVINNAGVVCGKMMTELSVEEYTRTMAVNCIGPFSIIKECLPDLLTSNSDGLIVSVGSLMSMLGGAGLTDYCSSKWALFGMHESLRLELMRTGNTNIRTLFVAPYQVNTSLFKGCNDEPRSFSQRLVSTVFPVLDADAVAARIVSAMECGETFVTLPWIFRVAPYVLHVFPTQVQDYVLSIFGGTHGMDDFRGNLKVD